MSHERMGIEGAHHYPHAVDMAALQPRLLALAEQSATAAFTAPQMTKALANGLEEAATLMRAVPVQEGNLIEKGIALLAGLNSDLVALTENIRLPVSAAALQLVELNDEQFYRRLTLDADAGGRKAYTPDMVLVNRPKRRAYVIDVKRTLASYEATRIADLKTRMLASSLMVPDLLYKEHRRLAVEEVQAVIINADGQKIDLQNGIWPLGHLDHLLELTGAGLTVEWLRSRFTAAIGRNWRGAVTQMSENDRNRRMEARNRASTTALGSGPRDADAPGRNHWPDGAEVEDADPSNRSDTSLAAGQPRDGARSNPDCKVSAGSGQGDWHSGPPPLRVGFARAPELAAAH